MSYDKDGMTLSFKVAPLGSTSYTADNGSASGSWTTLSALTNSSANMAGNYPANKSFTIIGTLSDKFTSVEFSATVATESVVMSYDKDGRVGIGKIAENGPAGSLDAAGDIYAGGKVVSGGLEITKTVLLNLFYPVGAIYQSTNNTNPSTLMGGTWERFGNGRVLVGVDEADSDFNTSNKTGGEKKHTLTIAEMPSHSHGQVVTANYEGPAIRRDWSSDGSAGIYSQGVQTEATGGGQAHNNLQPYITVYMWRRTA
jgi:hypothetical protein